MLRRVNSGFSSSLLYRWYLCIYLSLSICVTFVLCAIYFIDTCISLSHFTYLPPTLQWSRIYLRVKGWENPFLFCGRIWLSVNFLALCFWKPKTNLSSVELLQERLVAVGYKLLSQGGFHAHPGWLFSPAPGPCCWGCGESNMGCGLSSKPWSWADWLKMWCTVVLCVGMLRWL